MPVEMTTDLERTPLTSPETLRVRCPHCSKLYLVQFIDIQEAKPRFECVQCHSRFWLSMADLDPSGGEVRGIPLRQKDPPPASLASLSRHRGKAAATESCPKCFKPVEARRSECPHCGVVLEKIKNQMTFAEGLPPRSPALAALWKKVVADYADEALHAEFVRACQRERNLPYAGAQYAQMQKLMPMDEMTLRRMREVQSLGGALLPESEGGLKPARRFPHIWQMPLLAAALVIVVGLVLPLFRNMVGIGAVFLFLAFVLRRTS